MSVKCVISLSKPTSTWTHHRPVLRHRECQKTSIHTFLASSRSNSAAEWNPCRLLPTLFNCLHFPARSGSQSPSCKKFHFLKSCTACLLLQGSNAFPAHKLCWCRQSYVSIGGNFSRVMTSPLTRPSAVHHC